MSIVRSHIPKMKVKDTPFKKKKRKSIFIGSQSQSCFLSVNGNSYSTTLLSSTPLALRLLCLFLIQTIATTIMSMTTAEDTPNTTVRLILYDVFKAPVRNDDIHIYLNYLIKFTANVHNYT